MLSFMYSSGKILMPSPTSFEPQSKHPWFYCSICVKIHTSYYWLLLGLFFYKIALLSNLPTRFYYATCILHKRMFFISMSSQQLFCMFPYCLSVVGTSDGTQTHLNDPTGGHCNDTRKGIFMKIEVYVCKKSNLTYTGNVQFLQCN